MKTQTRSLISGFAITGIATLATVIGGITQAKAASITLFNTGVDATGNVLADGTIGDPHYTLTSVPVGSTIDIQTGTAAGGFPISNTDPTYWNGDNTLSTWIGPNNNNSFRFDSNPGDYTYSTTFNLTGMDISTASISGLFAADDTVTIKLNGATISTGGTYTAFSPFSISTGNAAFLAGLNTLDFVVNNTGGATGLRVELSGSANASPGSAAVPEPSEILGTAIACGAVLVLKRKMSTKTIQSDKN